MAALDYACMPWIAERLFGSTVTVDRSFVAGMRALLPMQFGPVLGLLALYWLVAAGNGRGLVRRANVANALLSAALVIFTLFNLISTTIPIVELRSAVCPLFGVSQVYPTYGFDLPSPCDLFIDRWGSAILIWLPLFLWALALALRLAALRR